MLARDWRGSVDRGAPRYNRSRRACADEGTESVEDPLEDWPEEPGGDAEHWLIERRGDDLERDD